MKIYRKKILTALLAIALVVMIAPNMANANSTLDNNDTSSDATILSSERAVTGVISSDDDVDFYKYTVDVTGHYNFTLTDTGTQGNRWRLTVYDSALKELESNTNSEYTLTTNTYNFEKGRVLYLKVQDSYRTKGDPYSLVVNATEASDWEQEYTDTKDDATILDAKITMHGNIYSDDDDVDFFKYTVGVTGHFNFTLKDAAEKGGRWRLTVYDSSLNELESNTNSDYSLTTNTYNFKKGTELYLKVADSYRSEGYEYTLTVNETAASNWEQEANDTKATATVIKANQTKYGNLYSDDDVDYYKYKVDVTGYYSFIFNDTKAEGGRWRITVYDSSLKELESVTNDDNTLTTNTYNFKKGTVLYLKVSDSYRAEYHEYSLKVIAKKSGNWEQEKNNSFKCSIGLKLNTVKYGNLYNEDDVDYYSYTATKTGSLKTSFKFDADDVGRGWKVTIYDSSKKEIKTVTDITTDKTISFKVTKGKKYYVVVKSSSSYSSPTNITYQLKIK